MIQFENTKVMNFDGAFRGMRNPMNSWNKSDSIICDLDRDNPCHGLGCKYYGDEYGNFCMGESDLALAQTLIKAGSDHRKFLRQIFVSMDITAPLYWWKEFDTYKMATVANSCSTMHKIHSKEFVLDDFSHERMSEKARTVLLGVIEQLNESRDRYNETHDVQDWDDMIQLLPTSYNQRRTVTLNYETLRNIYGSRNNHKLPEWRVGFMAWIHDLPYAEELITYC